MNEIKELETAKNAIDFRKCFAYPTENFKTKAQYDVKHYIYGGVKKGR